MENLKFGPYALTTNHPQSSYGAPVLIYNGAAYGPDDEIEGRTAIDRVCHFLGQYKNTPQKHLDAFGKWSRASNDPVYADSAREIAEGKTIYAGENTATEWLIDPETGETLPQWERIPQPDDEQTRQAFSEFFKPNTKD